MSHWSRLVPMIVILLLLGAGPALAHDDEGVLKVVAVVDDSAGYRAYEVTLHYGSDGHPAIDATVTVAGDGPDGEVLSPVTLGPADPPGTYRGRVEFPVTGAWSLRISSLQPTAQLDHIELVGSTDGPTEPPAPTVETEPAPTADPLPEDASSADLGVSDPHEAGPDRSSTVAWTVGIVATFVVAAGILAVWSAQRRAAE